MIIVLMSLVPFVASRWQLACKVRLLWYNEATAIDGQARGLRRRLTQARLTPSFAPRAASRDHACPGLSWSDHSSPRQRRGVPGASISMNDLPQTV